MGLLDRLFKREASAPRQGLQAGPSAAECPHLAVAPRWDSVGDIGHEDRATSFVCDSCHQAFSPTEIDSIRSAAASRLRNI
ncbi:MAG: hypothetical protein O2822_00970 [Chloroflexi bacterium]|nr:hypothetical protein [Chloroflexota bacterium]